MEDSNSQIYPTLQKFQSPAEQRPSANDCLDKEYFLKISHPSGRRFSTFPALAISDDKIVQKYGSTSVDVTHQFYSGPETVYNISPISPEKDITDRNSKHSRNSRPKKGRDNFGKRGGKNSELAPLSLDGSIRGLENQRTDAGNVRRRSANSLGERQLGFRPMRRLASAGTDLSSDREFLDEIKESLRQKESCFNSHAWNPETPVLSELVSGESGTCSTPLYASDTSKPTENNVLYMTGTNTSRVVSKGELKVKKVRSRKHIHTEMASVKTKTSPARTTLAISGKAPEAKTSKDLGSYQIRQKYADDIERKWFIDKIQKVKDKKEDAEWLKRRYDLRLDMFYSPEPGEESQTDSEDNDGQGSLDDPVTDQEKDVYMDDTEVQVLQVSFNNGNESPLKGFSEKPKFFSQQRPFVKPKTFQLQNQSQDKRNLLRHFDSTDVLVGNVGEMEESSGSDIETVLQNGELQQRRCKHKMYRKRRRQQKRYKPFIQVPNTPNDTDEDEANGKVQSIRSINVDKFSIKELRSMRLKNKKKSAPCLRGIKRFRQVANSVFIFIQFRRLLLSMRRARRRAHKRSLKKVRKVKWNNELEIYSKFERQNSPVREPIHEKFMKEIGLKLLDDIAKLPIPTLAESYTTGDSDGEGVDEMQTRRKGMSFYREVQKADFIDINNISLQQTPMRRERRLSEPDPERLDYIVFTLPEKPATKKQQRKYHNSRSKSPSKSKNKAKQRINSTATLVRAPNHLPPLVTPPCLGGSRSATEGHKHNHAHSPSNRRKQSPRKSSKSPSKRSRSQSPLEHKKTSPSSRPPREVKIWPEAYRPRSYSASYVKFKKVVDLRELLKDADIPAKEVTIQIIERKRKRRMRKMADAAARRETMELQRKIAEEKAEIERERLAELQRREEARKLAEARKARKHSSPFVPSGVAWNQRRPRKIPSWTNQELDSEITKLSGLFFEMRNCSYIRWNNKDQAILQRLAELEEVKI